jgi:hypothetical protein
MSVPAEKGDGVANELLRRHEASRIIAPEQLMPIPDYQTLMLPLLKAVVDGNEHRIGDVTQQLAQEFHLTSEERQQLLPSGTQTSFANRVGWAKSYLIQAGLLGNKTGLLQNHGTWSKGLRRGPLPHR